MSHKQETYYHMTLRHLNTQGFVTSQSLCKAARLIAEDMEHEVDAAVENTRESLMIKAAGAAKANTAPVKEHWEPRDSSFGPGIREAAMTAGTVNTGAATYGDHKLLSSDGFTQAARRYALYANTLHDAGIKHITPELLVAIDRLHVLLTDMEKK